MPSSVKRPCPVPGCPELVPSGRCPRHAAEQRARDAARPSRNGWHRWAAYPKAWRSIRAAYIAAHPLCEICGAPAQHVDHRDGDTSHGEPSNLAALCRSCHSRKTARENGGFGNPRRRGNRC